MLTPVQGLGQIATIAEAVRRITEALPTWQEDALVELFRQSSVLQERSLMVRCGVVAELVRRYSGGAKRIKATEWQTVATILGERTTVIRELYNIWIHIFSRLGPDEDLALPERFLQQAVRARKYGKDPLEAARYASHMRNVLNPRYSLEEFRQDIRDGLPDPETKKERRIACYECPYYRVSQPDDIMILARAKEEELRDGKIHEILAIGPAPETEYCEFYGIMGEPFYEKRLECKGAPCTENTGCGRSV